jgi:hypothetical protein
VVDLALGPPPGERTHWTGRELAKAAGVSLRSVQRILEAHQLAPHRIRTFKLSNDPEFVEKFRDIVGLYVDPPAHAVVLSVDEKSQIQALDRTQPGLPMKKGRAGTMTHDYDDIVAELVLADEGGAFGLLRNIADFRRHNHNARPAAVVWSTAAIKEFTQAVAPLPSIALQCLGLGCEGSQKFYSEISVAVLLRYRVHPLQTAQRTCRSEMRRNHLDCQHRLDFVVRPDPNRRGTPLTSCSLGG